MDRADAPAGHEGRDVGDSTVGGPARLSAERGAGGRRPRPAGAQRGPARPGGELQAGKRDDVSHVLAGGSPAGDERWGRASVSPRTSATDALGGALRSRAGGSLRAGKETTSGERGCGCPTSAENGWTQHCHVPCALGEGCKGGDFQDQLPGSEHPGFHRKYSNNGSIAKIPHQRPLPQCRRLPKAFHHRLPFWARPKFRLRRMAPRKLQLPEEFCQAHGARPNEECEREVCFAGFQYVPRKKRSNLGMVFVRICPRFSIRNLPNMYEDFKRDRENMDKIRQHKERPDFELHGAQRRKKRFIRVGSALSVRFAGPPPKKRPFAGTMPALGPPSPGPQRPQGTPAARPPNYTCMREMFAGRQLVRAPSAAGRASCEAFQAFKWHRGEANAACRQIAECCPAPSLGGFTCGPVHRALLPDTGDACGEFSPSGLQFIQGLEPAPDSDRNWASCPGVCSPDVPKTTAPKASQIIAALMKAGGLELGEKLQYRTRQGAVLAEGWAMWSSILCARCGGVVGPTGFERCAGSLARRPCNHIFTPAGQSLHSLYRGLSLGRGAEGGGTSADEDGSPRAHEGLDEDLVE
ncbi:unnamed protein product [Ostreobium quekettii]|uniref:Tify domain-containing protein n=1 Tax=Ostreobium quekettii TaxID=121088 RepID=A0A8S1JF55_9CHLO|nr:unnamed protein product [Ostreobium quekettii]|eukprot:evm.model.scf_1373.2 EVM.evm.TU.scf_1373.2   scf_1373:12107-17927(+)